MNKLCKKCASKISPKPFFLVNNPKQPLYAKKSLNKNNFILSFKPSPRPSNRQDYEKQNC